MKSLISIILNNIKTFLFFIWSNKKKPKIFLSVIGVIAVLVYIFFPKSNTTTYKLFTTQQEDFVQEVSVTGKVTPAQKVDLSFEVGGRINQINVIVGQKVKTGEVLAKLSNEDFQASVQKNQAEYLNQQAKLRELERGARPEEISIANSKVTEANQNLVQAKLAVIESIKSAYSKADDAIKSKADQVFLGPRSVNPELIFFVDGNYALKGNIEFQRLRITEIIPKWQLLITAISNDTVSESQITEAQSYMQQVQKMLNDLNAGLTSTGINLNQEARFVGYRTDISAARLSVNSALQDLNSTANALRNSESALIRANEEFSIKKTGNTIEEIDSQRANTQGAAAGISGALASLNKTLIKASFDGIVTRVAYKIGESVSSTDAIVTIMSDSAYEIETFVSENDVSKLKKGQLAKVTLDALGDAVVFDAMITVVDLSETVTDGVVTYKTRLQFKTEDEKIKSGLTSNIVVETDKRSGVISVPQSAIVIINGKKNVKVVPVESTTWNSALNNKATLVPVSTGSIDKEGNIEITNGLQAGEKIIIKFKTK